MRVRFSLAIAAGACAAMLVPAAAQAVVCGTTDPASGDPARAVVTLNELSDTDAVFKQDTGKRSISLIYTAQGCTFSGSEPDPKVTPMPRSGAKDIPAGAVTLVDANPDGSELSLTFEADSEKFSPGSYGGLVQVGAPYLVTVRTPINVSRSEDTWLIPVGIGAIAGIFALLWFYFTRRVTKDGFRLVGWKAWTGATAATMVAGAIASWTSYNSQEVWVLGDNWIATATAAFTGATTGSMLVLLLALGRAPALEPKPDPRPDPQPDPA